MMGTKKFLLAREHLPLAKLRHFGALDLDWYGFTNSKFVYEIVFVMVMIIFNHIIIIVIIV